MPRTACNFSLLLPEGGRSAIQKPEVIGAVHDARRANASRAARGLPLVRLLNRVTGKVYDVPPDADALALADEIEAES